MTRLRRSFVVLGVLASLAAPLAAPRSAAADESAPDAARAAEIKKRGDVAMDSGNAADAYAAYVEAYALSKEPALLYNQGRAAQALGDFPKALAQLEAFDKEAPAELKARVPGLPRMIAELRARVTTLVVTCDTMRARVVLREKTIGSCPLPESVVVMPGRARLEVTADGFFPYVKDVELPPGGRTTLDVRLQSRSTMAVLLVKTTVPNAVVTVDGSSAGMAPTETFVAPGEHVIAVRRDGFGAAETRAVLAAGERRELDLPLVEKKGILSTWWFWTGVGVVVAGGVALAVALQVEKSPEPGTLAPGVVSGGLTSFRF